MTEEKRYCTLNEATEVVIRSALHVAVRPTRVYREIAEKPISMDDSNTVETRYRRPPSLVVLSVLMVVIISILSILPGPGPLTFNNPSGTILGGIWIWLSNNKDSIAPLSQIASALGVIVAATTFLRSQRMNRADWLFRVLKEVSEKIKDLQKNGLYRFQNFRNNNLLFYVIPIFPLSTGKQERMGYF